MPPPVRILVQPAWQRPGSITIRLSAGEIAAGPFLYLNTLGQARVRHPFLFQKPQDGNFSPRSATFSMQVEQPIARNLKLRAGYTSCNDRAPGPT